MKKIIFISIGCLLLCFFQTVDGLSANVYVWTDENGVKHYSNVAPPESAGESVDQVDELSEEGQDSGQPSLQQSLEAPDAEDRDASEAIGSEALDSEESEPAELPEDTAADETPLDASPAEDLVESEDTGADNDSDADIEESEDTEGNNDSDADIEEPEDTATEDETEADIESSDAQSAPLIQGDAVEQEKDQTRQLLEALSEGNQSSQDLIENEKRRLEQTIADLEQQPLERFGSQKNKQRQIGFYQNRLQQLNSSPEIYLQYGDEE